MIETGVHTDDMGSYYKALSFYVQEQPLLVTDLLSVLIPRVDHSRVVRMFSRQQFDHIPLIRTRLTRALPALLPEIRDEVARAFADFADAQPQDEHGARPAARRARPLTRAAQGGRR